MRDEVLIKAPVGSHGNLDLGKQKSQGEMFAQGWREGKRGEREDREEDDPRPNESGLPLLLHPIKRRRQQDPSLLL